MKKFICVLLVIMGVGSFRVSQGVCSEIKESAFSQEHVSGGATTINDRVICADGLKIFQSVVLGFGASGGVVMSSFQLYEERNGKLYQPNVSKVSPVSILP